MEWPTPEPGPRVPFTPRATPTEAPLSEYPEEWGEVDDYIEATAGADDAGRDPSPGAPGPAAEPADTPSPGHDAELADAPPPVRRDRNPLASASRSVRRKGHFPSCDPRHDGPRLFTWHEGAEICRQWNRGSCAPTREGPEGHYGVCKHWRHHVCSTCGSADHPAFSCTTPEADWPPKQ